MTHIKICGLTEPAQAMMAVEAGADCLGMVLAPSRHQISPEGAMEIVKSVRRLKSSKEVVGVFVNATCGEVNRIADMCDLDWVQLSGDEPWEYCRDIERPIIKVIHISTNHTAYSILKEIETGHRLLSEHKFCGLLDTYVPNVFGGTGQSFDRKIAREISTVFPVFIAGGLTPDNVGHLVQEIRPWGVDVSSGVETNGTKDIQKIKDFIRAVRSN
jgi:phosphoribosylanthranilate isomerase